MEAAFCVETLEDAMAHHGKPEIFNTDQGLRAPVHGDLGFRLEGTTVSGG
jgi:hypothetical protein